MPQVQITAQMLSEALRNEFADTYLSVQNRASAAILSEVMDLGGVTAVTRNAIFGYIEAAPHMAHWEQGSSIPTDSMGSTTFTVPVYDWARRVEWHKNDREDEQTGTLVDQARMAGQSAAMLPERFFIDLLGDASPTTLPAVPTAGDGAALFSATDGNNQARFGVSGGNIVTGSGVTTSSQILTDYYKVMTRMQLFQDGKGQPLHPDGISQQGVVIVFGAAYNEVYEEAFKQRRRGEVLGTDAGVTPSNIVQDASRDVTLWSSSRITTTDAYVFVKGMPKKPTFVLNRKGLQEFSALEGMNNSDHVRDTGQEYMQWETRQGAGISLPYACVKINNS